MTTDHNAEESITDAQRDVPYPGDLAHFTQEERWLLGEPRPPTSGGHRLRSRQSAHGSLWPQRY
jgi:hypothetical protein